MLQDKFTLLARNPDLGRVRDEITEVRTASTNPLRSFPVNKYFLTFDTSACRISPIRESQFSWGPGLVHPVNGYGNFDPYST